MTVLWVPPLGTRGSSGIIKVDSRRTEPVVGKGSGDRSVGLPEVSVGLFSSGWEVGEIIESIELFPLVRSCNENNCYVQREKISDIILNLPIFCSNYFRKMWPNISARGGFFLQANLPGIILKNYYGGFKIANLATLGQLTSNIFHDIRAIFRWRGGGGGSIVLKYNSAETENAFSRRN